MSASDESAREGAGAGSTATPTQTQTHTLAAARLRLGAGTLAAARDVNRHYAERIAREQARLQALPPDPAEAADATR